MKIAGLAAERVRMGGCRTAMQTRCAYDAG